MKNIAQIDLLNELLIAAEHKQAYDLQLLKEQFHITSESLKPINLIKNLFHDVTTAPEIKNNMVNTAIGLATGFLSQKLFLGSSLNPIKRGIGTLIQFAVTNLVSKNSDGIKSIGGNIVKRFLSFKKN